MNQSERRKVLISVLEKNNIKFSEDIIEFLSQCEILDDQLEIEGRAVWIDLQSDAKGATLDLARKEMEKYKTNLVERKEAAAPVLDRPEIHEAVSDGDREKLKTILAVNKDSLESISSADDGMTPLLLACWMRDPGMVDQLIAAGADINFDGQHFCSPIHYGVYSLKILSALLKAGADPDRLSEDDITPLHLVSSDDKYSENVKMLLLHGARTDMIDRNGESPLDVARMKGANVIVDIYNNQDRLK